MPDGLTAPPSAGLRYALAKWGERLASRGVQEPDRAAAEIAITDFLTSPEAIEAKMINQLPEFPR